MKQLVQNYRTGEIKLIDTPAPLVGPNEVLVENAFSVVSLGTEKSMMEFAKKNIVSKALSRPDLTKQVLDFAKTRGFLEAYRQAISRLDNYIPLGYSSAGEVIDVGNNVKEFQVGDRVACARSGFASHAEIISVPKNLCVEIPAEVKYEHAAFTTLGAIAIHAFRLTELGLGNKLAIIGVGLLGQIAVQLSATAGVDVFAVDVVDEKISLAKSLGAMDGALAEDEGIMNLVKKFTKGFGFDAVIIFAHTESTKPLKLAADICREKGKIIVPGLVGLDVPRAIFYDKELSLIISRSTGPGIYNDEYELKGIDFPYAYVRWTTKRNMESFLELLKNGKIDIEPLITSRHSISEAENVYNKLYKSIGSDIGVILYYDKKEERKISKKLTLKNRAQKKGLDIVNIGLIGAGNFAKGTILPHIKKIPYINLHTIATKTGTSCIQAGNKYNFEYCTTDYREIFENPDINCVIIATKHNLHSKLVIEAFKYGKDVFVEKPLAISLDEIVKLYKSYENYEGKIMVGFMRRFSPISIKVKNLIKNRVLPLTLLYRINAESLPLDSWVYDPELGGGRIIGEICHFIDLVQYFTDSYPLSLYAKNIQKSPLLNPTDNAFVNINLADESLASILYTSLGDRGFPRERIEIFNSGNVYVIDDFKNLYSSKDNLLRKIYNKIIALPGLSSRDVGYKNEFFTFFECIKKDIPIPVQFQDYLITSISAIAIEESIKTNSVVKIDLEKIMRSHEVNNNV